ncbi:MAG: bifunctional helix-turn-helix transcriptional regulator/GNAT family N-acetyltransferase [Acetobacteraceae bacterium]
MPDPDRIAAVRRFNRFYTARIGVLHEGLHDSRFSLAEARVLYELAHNDTTTAAEMARALDLDPGYLSRILERFLRRRLIDRSRSNADGRQRLLRLTEAGRNAFAPLDAGAREEIGALLDALPEPAQAALADAMARIETLLAPTPNTPAPRAPAVLRPPRPGDIGWVIARHGALYAEEYGLDARFEALVGKVAAGFLAAHDPAREACWVAERDGVNLGSVFLVRASDELAKLRLLLVEPAARGEGLGRRLVDACVDFARACGYQRITLWTNDVLVAARRVYQSAGFRLIASKPHADFGPKMVGEDWELELRP